MEQTKVTDYRFLGTDTQRRIRAGYPPYEVDMEICICLCGELCIYDYDSKEWVCQSCLDIVLRTLAAGCGLCPSGSLDDC